MWVYNTLHAHKMVCRTQVIHVHHELCFGGRECFTATVSLHYHHHHHHQLIAD